MRRRGGVVQAVENGSSDCFVECAAEHCELALLVVASGEAVCQVSALGSCRQCVEKGMQGGT